MADKREAVAFLVTGGLSVRRACMLAQVHRSTFHSTAHPTGDAALREQIQDLAINNQRYGYRRIHIFVTKTKRVNQTRIRRLWQQHRLQVRPHKRRRTHRSRPEQLQAAYPGHLWAYDVVEDALADGTPCTVLTVMDEFTREGLALDLMPTTSAERVIGVLATLVGQHGAPHHLRRDNGPEFVAQSVQRWLADYGIQTLYIEPGNPWQHGKEERFNGTVRDECVNMHLFGTVAEACVRLNTCRHHDNTERPHSRLGYLSPLAFKVAWVEAQQKRKDSTIVT